MKRILLPFAICMALCTGCTDDVTIEVPKGQEIAFSNTFVNNAGRADILNLSPGTFHYCNLWGTSSTVGNFIFDNTMLNIEYADPPVSATYEGAKRYWTPGTEYHFMALASTVENAPGLTYTKPSNIPTANGPFGVLTFNNRTAQGRQDLGYASADVTTSDPLEKMSAVNLNFTHALARIRFRFINQLQGYKLDVYNIKVNGLPYEGTLTFSATPSWSDLKTQSDEEFEASPFYITFERIGTRIFGQGVSAHTEPMFTLPITTSEFTVEFDLDLYTTIEGNDIKYNGNAPYHHVVAIPDQTLSMNRAYIFSADIGEKQVDPEGLQEIQFTATIEDLTSSSETFEIDDLHIAD